MTNQEKLNLIEDALEIDLNTLNEDTNVEEIEEFDSMGKLTLIVLFDDEFNKKLSGEEIKAFKTMKDILDLMN